MRNIDLLVYDNAPMGLAMTQHRIIQTCNETFASMFGFQKQYLIGQSFRLFYGSDHEFHQIRDIGLEPLRQALPYTDERLMRHADGSRIWCRFRARTLTPQNPLERVVLSFALIDNTQIGPKLTQREREVLMLLSKGHTSKEIGLILGLSPRTIEDIRARLLKKFKVKNVKLLLARLSVTFTEPSIQNL